MEVLKEKIHRQNYDIIYEELLHVNFDFYKQYFTTCTLLAEPLKDPKGLASADRDFEMHSQNL
jgi:hypothetical protein